MEDNINLDDEEYFIKDILNEEDRKKSINKLLLKIFNRAHEKPLLLKKAMTFKDWKINAGIKLDESTAQPKIKKNKKKIKKKKTIKKEKTEGELNIENISTITNNGNLNQDIIEYICNNENMEEKKDEKTKKVKKIIKKKKIKKKLSFLDETDKNSIETNLTSPKLIVNKKLDQIKKKIKKN